MKKIIFTTIMTLCAFTFTMAQYNEGIKVNFKGNKPTISDFVTAVLSQEELGEGLGGMVEIWEKHLKGQPLPKGYKITVDAKNGYVSYEFTYEEDNQHSIIEFCYWNCSDGQHKLLGQNQKVFINGEYIQTELTGTTFYMYTDKTRKMNYVYTSDLGDEIDWPQNANLIELKLPRVGKSIEYVFKTPSGVVTKKLTWNGKKFVKG